ncbi:RNA-splicing factor [Coemansia helicoidea]|uniref:RNA-splicing factor n=1 Tax=Coemansia helicoidea TaxID=1286919 RepID=A0ACC1LC95_9FUNG|nr:RNA-splicing factor [Coemansia helicoidea]
MSGAAASPADPPLFKKSRRRGANIRKRPADEAADPADPTAEGDTAPVWGDTAHGPRAAKQARPAKTEADSISATAAPTDAAEVAVEYHYRRAVDASHTEEPAAPPPQAASSDREPAGAGDAYRGRKAYTNRAPGTGSMRAGPVRAPTNVRTTCVVDYQPSVCKDYKETGFCGYGDSCIFLHDRGVYKTGWQLEKEFEEQQQGVQRDNPRLWQTAHSDDGSADEAADGDGLPFACMICRKPFENPVVTRCQHYFCEACALARYRKSPKCFACGAATAGVFKKAKNLAAKEASAARARDGGSRL